MSFLDKLKAKVQQQTEAAIEAAKNAIADEEVQKERIVICLKCEYLIPKIDACRKCGCLVHAKTHLKAEKCPMNKW